jgi:hypothetical protein
MTTRTRYFVIASLLVLAVGLGTGLAAYYGFQTGAFARRGGPEQLLEELRYLPRDAAVIAYANVHDIMVSELRERVRRALPGQENGQREFQNETGINIETDIDHVVASLDQSTDGLQEGIVIARGRFDAVKIEASMGQHGARVEDYRGKRLLVIDAGTLDGGQPQPPTGPQGSAGAQAGVGATAHHGITLAFANAGVVAVGSTALVRRALAVADVQGGAESVVSNAELMNLVRSLDDGNAWAVGRFDALRSRGRLPEGVAQLPAITWFSVTSHVNGGIRGVLRAETGSEQAANDLRDVVRGFMALAKLQAASRPELQPLLQSLELGGTDKTVALSFFVPPQAFEVLGKMGRTPGRRPGR